MQNNSQVFLICGSGGVGKTTVSAAFGLKHASAGKKVVVMTIDPARRLATSLGLSELSHHPVQISLQSLNQKNNGSFFAMMLDTKSTFDHLVEKYATSPETKNKILNNKLYQHLSKMMAGTQEYMAMEKLYDIYQQNIYDVIIVDTPSLQNAADFLAAPEKMKKMIGNSMLQTLLKPSLSFGIKGLEFLERGTSKILKLFDKITGFDLLKDISEMAIAFKDLLVGFEQRAESIQQLFLSENCFFLPVCSTHSHSVQEAIRFKKRLHDYQFRFFGFIVNRVYVDTTQHKHLSAKDFYKVTEDLFNEADTKVLYQNFQKYLPLIKSDQEEIKRLKDESSQEDVVEVPLFLTDVHSLESLAQVAKFL